MTAVQARPRPSRAAALLLCLGAVACGPKSGQTPAPGEEVENSGPPAAAPTGGTGAPRRGGELARADLNHVLDAGPGAFLARGEIKARLVGGQFHGWEIVRTPFPSIDIVPGDVLVKVNGLVLEHPVDLDRLWNDLRSANTIDLDIERAGRRFALHFAIVPAL